MADEDLAAFRRRARQWLADAMPRLPPGGYPTNPMASDEHDRFSRARELQRRLHDGGFAGLSFPVEYGGHGLPPEYQAAFVEEAAGYEMPLRFTMPTLGIIGATLLDVGTEEQKRRYLPAMLRGDELWVQFMSEPSCGSDLAGAVTRATHDGDVWVLNGAKVWSSAAYGCDFALCLARTDWDVPKHAGLTMFVMDLTAPGITLRRILQVDGSADFCEEFFDDVTLPADAVVGEVDGGWAVATRLLAHERDSVGGGSPYIGNVRVRRQGNDGRLLALALRGGRAGEPRVRDEVAEAHVLATVSDQLVERLRVGTRRGRYTGPVGALLKLFRATAAMRSSTIELDVAGTDAVVGSAGDADGRRPALQFLMRQGGSLAGGSNEMQRNIISERLLGMPREAAPDREVAFSEVRRGRA